MPSRPFELVIFDCDGVLVDSEGLSADVLTRLLAEHGVEIDFDYFCVNCLGRSFPTVANDLRERLGVVLPDGFEARYRATLLDVFGRNLQAMPGIEPVLDALEVDYALATSSSRIRCLKSLGVTGLAERFDGRVFTSADVARGKPFPDLFEHVAAARGVPRDACLVVEDSLPGIEAARAANMAVARFTGGTHLRGRKLKHPPDTVVFDRWSDFNQVQQICRSQPR